MVYETSTCCVRNAFVRNLMQENEQLKKKLRKMRNENAELKEELSRFREEKRMKEFLQQHVTTRTIEVQTDPWKPLVTSVHVQKKPVITAPPAESESQKVNKLLSMHNNLMKRYEKELKVNIAHMDTINHLNVQIGELEQKIRTANSRIAELEAPKGKKISPQETTGLHRELREMRKQRDRLTEDKKKLKMEIQGLDHGFFEEVEDLKFALQQSAKLNKEYEHCLRKFSKQFGVPYPNPENCLDRR